VGAVLHTSAAVAATAVHGIGVAVQAVNSVADVVVADVAAAGATGVAAPVGPYVELHLPLLQVGHH